MKTRISLIIATAILSLSAAQVWAGVDKNLLVGDWTGGIIVNYHGKKKAVRVDMTFHVDGRLIVTQLKTKRADEVMYKIDGDKISMTKDGKTSYIDNVKLTQQNLIGDMVSADPSQTPKDISIELQLTRQKSDKDKPESSPEESKPESGPESSPEESKPESNP